MNIKNYKIQQLNYCINCDYNCETVCPVFQLTKNKALTPKNKAIKALSCIKSWNFNENIDIYACINCNNCKNYCPHKNDISEVLEYAKEKTISSNNAIKEIMEFEEYFYKKLKISDFLKFYNLGFRDETITELKSFFRNIKKNEIIIDDMSFIFIVNKLKPFLNNIKLAKIKYDFNKKPDYKKILSSSLNITHIEIYEKLNEKLDKIEQVEIPIK